MDIFLLISYYFIYINYFYSYLTYYRHSICLPNTERVGAEIAC